MFTPKIIKSYTIHPEILHIVFLALKTYLIPFFPHCPPYTSWDNPYLSSLIVVLPILIQQFRSCAMFLGFTQMIFLRLLNILHNRSVHLQCRKRSLTVSTCPSHKKHLAHSWNFPFFIFSCVSTASFASNHVKQFTLYGILGFHIICHGQRSILSFEFE